MKNLHVVASHQTAYKAVRNRLTQLGFAGSSYLLTESQSELTENGAVVWLTVEHESTGETLKAEVKLTQEGPRGPWNPIEVNLLNKPTQSISVVLLPGPDRYLEPVYPVQVHSAIWLEVATDVWAWKVTSSSLADMVLPADEGRLWIEVPNYQEGGALSKMAYLALVMEKGTDALRNWAIQIMRKTVDIYGSAKPVQVRKTSSSLAIGGVGAIDTSFDVALLCCTGLVVGCIGYTAFTNGWHMPSLEGEGPWTIRGFTKAEAHIEHIVTRENGKPCHTYRLVGSSAKNAVASATELFLYLKHEEQTWLRYLAG